MRLRGVRKAKGMTHLVAVSSPLNLEAPFLLEKEKKTAGERENARVASQFGEDLACTDIWRTKGAVHQHEGRGGRGDGGEGEPMGWKGCLWPIGTSARETACQPTTATANLKPATK